MSFLLRLCPVGGIIWAVWLLQCTQPDARLHPSPKTAPALPPSTTFVVHPPNQCGIQFVPAVEDEFRYNFMADPYIYNGGGVAVLDVNNDGLQDLFFTARLQGCRLYLNKGGFKFEDISEKSGVSQFSGLKTGVCVVDINADGWADLYVCRTWLSPLPDRRNLLLINQKDGTFAEHAAAFGLDDLSASQHANFFDYDLDGDLDCYVLNHPVDFKNMNNLAFPAGSARTQTPQNQYESDRLYRRDGNTFTDITQKAGLENKAFGLSTLVVDVNDDGWPDLLVGNDFVMPDFLYINQKNGTFKDEADAYFRHTSNHTMGADAADLNRDGWLDFVTLDMLAEDWPRRQRLMSTMSIQRDQEMQQKGYGRQAMRNCLQLSEGSGQYSEVGHLAGMAATDWSWAPLIADFDHDGWRDIFLTSGVKRDLNDLDFFVYTADSINRTGGVNKTRFPDFSDYAGQMPSQPSHPYLFQNTGTFPYREVSESWGLRQSGFSNGAAYADLDNDGDLDLIINNLEAAPGVFENRATENTAHHWLQITCAGTAQNPAGTGAKVRVWAGGLLVFSQEMTPIRGFYSSVQPIFQIGLGMHKMVDKIEIDWSEKKHEIRLNVAANQRIQFNIQDAKQGLSPKVDAVQSPHFEEVTAKTGLQFSHKENEFEDFNQQKLLPYRLSRSGPRTCVGDINGDGETDLFVCGAAGQAGAVFIQLAAENGMPQFKRIPQPALENHRDCEDTDAVWFDADQDGDLDLYVVSGGNEGPANDPLYQDRLYLNDGKGTLSVASNVLPRATHSGSCVLALDINGDGKQDLLVGGRAVPGRFPEPAPTFLLQNMGGKFSQITVKEMPILGQLGMVTDLFMANLSPKSPPVVWVAADWQPLRRLIFGAEVKMQNIGPSGWWRCLAVADLDQDGDLDVVAGNWGQNSRHQATEQAPLRLFAQDLDQNGSLDPLFCTPWEGAYYPLASRDLLASQLPLIKKKFQRYAPFSKATISDLFPEKDWFAGLNLEAQTLETQWFEQKNGQFIPHALPIEAQFAPTNSIVAADVTGDGQLDIMLVGNDWGADPETYRQDASSGCLLAGDGRGGFQYISGKQSGFRSADVGRDLQFFRAATGKNVLVLGTNSGPLQIFQAK